MSRLAVLVGILLLANVSVFLWPTSADSASHVHRSRTDINPHFLRLNKEIEDRFYAQSKQQQKVVQRIGFEEGQLIEGELETETLAQLGGDSHCYRLGPFTYAPNYELAQAVLFNAGLDYTKSIRDSKESNVYRVYLGPYANSALVKDARSELKRKNILDQFIRKESDGTYIISLGIYTTRETAERALMLFDGKVDKVKLKSERVVLPETYWLYFSLEGKDRVKQELALIDWGEKSAKMGKYECRV